MKKKHRIEMLLVAENVLTASQNRGNIPTNHAVTQNVKRLKNTLAGFRKAQEVEPLCWLAPGAPLLEDDEREKEAQEELTRWYNEELAYEPYLLSVDRLCDELAALSPVREWLGDEELQRLREDFSLVLEDLGILKED